MTLALRQEQQVGISFDNHQVQLIKDTICKGATNEEFQLFINVCQRSGLDPFAKQVYPVKRWDAKLGREVMTIQTSIDGYRLIAERTGRYAPGREPTYQYDKDGVLVSATAYVKKQTMDGTWHEVAAPAFFKEFVQCFTDKKTGLKKPTQFWENMPHNQLAKCAESLALRKAFPAELSAIYTKDEMAQSEVIEAHVAVKSITIDQCIELQKLLNDCEPKVKENALDYIYKKFKIEMLDDLPSTEFDRYKELFTMRKSEYQKKLIDAEVMNVNPDAEVVNAN